MHGLRRSQGPGKPWKVRGYRDGYVAARWLTHTAILRYGLNRSLNCDSHRRIRTPFGRCTASTAQWRFARIKKSIDWPGMVDRAIACAYQRQVAPVAKHSCGSTNRRPAMHVWQCMSGVCSSKERQGLRGAQVHSRVGFCICAGSHAAMPSRCRSGPAPRASRATPSVLADTVRSDVPTGLLACVNQAGYALFVQIGMM